MRTPIVLFFPQEKTITMSPYSSELICKLQSPYFIIPGGDTEFEHKQMDVDEYADDFLRNIKDRFSQFASELGKVGDLKDAIQTISRTQLGLVPIMTKVEDGALYIVSVDHDFTFHVTRYFLISENLVFSYDEQGISKDLFTAYLMENNGFSATL